MLTDGNGSWHGLMLKECNADISCRIDPMHECACCNYVAFKTFTFFSQTQPHVI